MINIHVTPSEAYGYTRCNTINVDALATKIDKNIKKDLFGSPLETIQGDELLAVKTANGEYGTIPVSRIGTGGGSQTKSIKITYQELKTLRDNSELVPGQTYQITDYETITTEYETATANHYFDVVVTAESENTLAQQAYAAHSERDTDGYFANSDLSKWILNYSLDNAGSEFEWAPSDDGYVRRVYIYGEDFDYPCLLERDHYSDTSVDDKMLYAFYTSDYYTYYSDSEDVTNESVVYSYAGETLENLSFIVHEGNFNPGKGIIYRMIDEFGNDLPYDFKNILIVNEYTMSGSLGLRNTNPTSAPTRTPVYRYTFGKTTDASLNDCSNNKVVADVSSLRHACFFGEQCTNNYLERCLGTILLGNNTNINLIEAPTLKIPYGVYNFSMGSNSSFSIVTVVSQSKMHDITIGEYCTNISLASEISNIIIGDNCDNIKISDSCTNITVGDYCTNNTFEQYCTNNVLGNNCNNNNFKCTSYTQFGNPKYSAASGNTLGEYCNDNTFMGGCSYNDLGDNCEGNVFQSIVVSSSVGMTPTYSVRTASGIGVGSYGSNNTFVAGCSSVTCNGEGNSIDGSSIKCSGYNNELKGNTINVSGDDNIIDGNSIYISEGSNNNITGDNISLGFDSNSNTITGENLSFGSNVNSIFIDRCYNISAEYSIRNVTLFDVYDTTLGHNIHDLVIGTSLGELSLRNSSVGNSCSYLNMQLDPMSAGKCVFGIHVSDNVIGSSVGGSIYLYGYTNNDQPSPNTPSYIVAVNSNREIVIYCSADVQDGGIEIVDDVADLPDDAPNGAIASVVKETKTYESEEVLCDIQNLKVMFDYDDSYDNGYTKISKLEINPIKHSLDLSEYYSMYIMLSNPSGDYLELYIDDGHIRVYSRELEEVIYDFETEEVNQTVINQIKESINSGDYYFVWNGDADTSLGEEYPPYTTEMFDLLNQVFQLYTIHTIETVVDTDAEVYIKEMEWKPLLKSSNNDTSGSSNDGFLTVSSESDLDPKASVGTMVKVVYDSERLENFNSLYDPNDVIYYEDGKIMFTDVRRISKIPKVAVDLTASYSGSGSICQLAPLEPNSECVFIEFNQGGTKATATYADGSTIEYYLYSVSDNDEILVNQEGLDALNTILANNTMIYVNRFTEGTNMTQSFNGCLKVAYPAHVCDVYTKTYEGYKKLNLLDSDYIKLTDIYTGVSTDKGSKDGDDAWTIRFPHNFEIIESIELKKGKITVPALDIDINSIGTEEELMMAMLPYCKAMSFISLQSYNKLYTSIDLALVPALMMGDPSAMGDVAWILLANTAHPRLYNHDSYSDMLAAWDADGNFIEPKEVGIKDNLQNLKDTFSLWFPFGKMVAVPAAFSPRVAEQAIFGMIPSGFETFDEIFKVKKLKESKTSYLDISYRGVSGGQNAGYYCAALPDVVNFQDSFGVEGDTTLHIRLLETEVYTGIPTYDIRLSNCRIQNFEFSKDIIWKEGMSPEPIEGDDCVINIVGNYGTFWKAPRPYTTA